VTDGRSKHLDKFVCTHCFRALGVPTKLELYTFIKEQGRVNVKTLVEFIHLTQPTVSHHLHELENSGLLKSEKVGKEVFFQVTGTCKVHNSSCILNDIKVPMKDFENVKNS